MALSKSLPKGQIPLGCQICEKNNKIQWRCETCENLLCDLCKTTVQARIGKNHYFIDVKNIGKQSIISVLKQYSVDIAHIHNMAVCKDGSLWIGESYGPRHGKIQHIRIEHDKIMTQFTHEAGFMNLAVSPSASTYIVKGGTILGIIDPMSGQIIDSKFKVQPWNISSVHVTEDHCVLLGASDGNHGIVIVMNSKGKQIKKYKHDNKQPIFKCPRMIRTTIQGDIVINDNLGNKVVVLKTEGSVRYYHGHPELNTSDKPMKPYGLLITPSDNILVVDFTSAYLHILNREAEIITYYNPMDIGIQYPYSLALNPAGNIYLGCCSHVNDPKGTKAKLYELTFSGF